MATKSGKEPSLADIPRSHHIAAWILMGLALLAVVGFHLLASLLAGLLVFQLVHMLSNAVRIPYLKNRHIKLLYVVLLAVVIVTVLVLAGVGIGVFVRRGPDNLSTMLAQIASIVDDLRRLLPDEIVAYLPSGTDGVKKVISDWFRAHATEVRTIGTDTLRAFAHVIIGLIIGAMVALHEVAPGANPSPFVRALSQRARLLAEAFRRIMLAQVPISTINTTLTAIYLLVVLPAFDVHLPFTKTLITITFIAGLLPVIGNLISNTAIFLVSLSHSFGVAASSLVFLIAIHKLEYFLNARIVGTRINARAWELLTAMLVFEAAFGVPGLIMAPLAYAYVKVELAEQHLL
jgi:predicted PurR-regulated permease PerM